MTNTQEQTQNEVVIRSRQDLTKKTSNSKVDFAQYWEKAYINQKLENIKNAKHQMLIRFLWMSGVRITEAVNLTNGDIDFQNYTMKVKWLKNRKYNYRNVPIHPALRNFLSLYCGTMKADSLVFPISRQRAWQLTKKYLGGHPHQLRHSFAVNWLRSDGDVVTLSRILGHSKIQTTMEYLKIVPIDQGKELMKINFF